MKLLDVITSEFIGIVEMLIQTEPIENNRIILKKETFKTLLEKNAYMKFSEKTKIYKQLNFIIHDKNSYTMSYRSKALKKTVRKVVINFETYQTLNYLYKNNIT